MSESFLNRWLKQKTLWIAAIVAILGIVVSVLQFPTIDWIMSHSVEEYIQRTSMILPTFLVFGSISILLWTYSLYITWKK